MGIKIIKGINLFWFISWLYMNTKWMSESGSVGVGSKLILVNASTCLFLFFVIFLIRNNKLAWVAVFIPPLLVFIFSAPWFVYNVGEALGYKMYLDYPGVSVTLISGSLTLLPACTVLYLLWRERIEIIAIWRGTERNLA